MNINAWKSCVLCSCCCCTINFIKSFCFFSCNICSCFRRARSSLWVSCKNSFRSRKQSKVSLLLDLFFLFVSFSPSTLFFSGSAPSFPCPVFSCPQHSLCLDVFDPSASVCHLHPLSQLHLPSLYCISSSIAVSASDISVSIPLAFCSF